ncbi:MAG: N4-gp56 family major capsid protein [Oscillospiraceae bacterium]|nr:N4-gp56 family major capsid protein [Oscillospiraceae bacterium]
MITLDLQVFAVTPNYTSGGTYLNGFTNPDGTPNADLSPEMKTYYSDYLIDMAGPKLVHDQFADKYPIPANKGKVIEFRKYEPLEDLEGPIQEGITPTGNKLTVKPYKASVEQYGDYIQLTDMLQLSAIDNNVVQATKLLGAQAGKTLDSITRDELNNGRNVWRPNGKTTRASLAGTDKLTVDLVFRVAAALKMQNAEPIDDAFVAIVHPYVAYDLMKDERWIDVHMYGNQDNIYDGELGKIAGVRFVESSQAKVFEQAAGTAPDKLDVYSTLIFGAHAYAITEITGGGLQHIVKQLGYGNDPLNQRSSCGWKATRAVKRLVEQYLIRIESCTGYALTKDEEIKGNQDE